MPYTFQCSANIFFLIPLQTVVLINILDIVNDDMKDWLSSIDDGVNAYFCKDLSEYICDYI